LRTLSLVQVSQRYSMPRAPDCTVHVTGTGTGSAVVPHHEQATALLPSSLTRPVWLKHSLAETRFGRNTVARRAPRSHTQVVTSPAYADEARARWGHTEAFRQSQRRAAGYTPADWDEIKRQTEALERQLAAAMHEGWPPDSVIAMDLAQAHRDLLSRWFYDCSPALHCALGTMYVDDDRFTQHYEQCAAGLASYLCNAIHANAARFGVAGV